MKIIGIIPARYGSTRLHAKPLAVIHGKPMVQHVFENASRSRLLSMVIVATDDKRIFETVMGFGGNAVMTSRSHKSGTDRVGEAARKMKCEIAVNIQGDEPYVHPANIDRAIEPLLKDKDINVSTLCYRISDKKDISNPNIVKVVLDNDNFALYFSRSVIPHNRDGSKVTYYKHLGLYVYRNSYLQKLVKLKPVKIETAEKLEQLRVLVNGERIKVVETKIDSHSVDTKEDLKKIIKLY
jgi:3-deoxy-manno-octulosonate cytidylyltransferase (CMP-KDO synthetase)